jgi:hypothetical protein
MMGHSGPSVAETTGVMFVARVAELALATAPLGKLDRCAIRRLLAGSSADSRSERPVDDIASRQLEREKRTRVTVQSAHQIHIANRLEP